MLIIDNNSIAGHICHIVELKYCRDTDREPQRIKALEQHRQLAADLERVLLIDAMNIHIHPIMLGVTGTIYSDFFDSMWQMGVKKQDARKCAKKLSALAVTYVKTIMTTKWNQERGLKQGVG